ncbi:TIGR01777 family oxidoreductase [Actinopolymorpha alba]|uniref:TIGR01777 family oxidoreductase n=1 Tax=Actinopolymorpha alba TaxID=533267 RepID=UPI00037CDC28|nr:TIGR01777 family oxidoreductase [Actinopolymorpha alba]
MRYVIAGASGFLGRALRAQLARDGHEVTRLVRSEPRTPHESYWNPARGEVDDGVLSHADVVVNLAGASIGRIPWTSSYRETLRQSRIGTTLTLARALAGLDDPPAFIAQSATGYYGKERGTEEIDEYSPPGEGFLADLARDWENSTAPAEDAGVRVVRLRTGLVLDVSGGAFPLMALPFRFGLGGRLGSGRQFVGMVSLPDWVAAATFVAGQADARGPYNVSLPEPTTNAELTAAIGAVLHRPTLLPAPAFALRLMLNGLADELLGSVRVLPRRLLEAGFTFGSPDVTSLVTTALHKPGTRE